MIIEQNNDLFKIRKIINIIVSLLEKNIENLQNGFIKEEDKTILTFLIGEKENIFSVVIKLSNLLIKLEILNQDKNEDEDDAILEEVDLKLIREYLNNMN